MADEVLSHSGKRETYTEFVEKFKPKKTTDDCMTPPAVYDAVADWVANEYGLDRADFVRPFWPGGDYENFDYPEGCVVVDNPPFSFLASIVTWYARHSIRFFLFAPALFIFTRASVKVACSISCGVSITYENGAKVPTSFLTNLDDARVRTAPELYKRVNDADMKNQQLVNPKTQLPKYTYPDNVLSPAMMNNWSKYGVEFSASREDTYWVAGLDAQKPFKKHIYGQGFLLSEKAAAEKAAAEKAAAEGRGLIVWELSDREREIIKGLGKKQDDDNGK